jgi:hypothetical protein
MRGGVLELIARGKKDAFFTSNPKTSFFHSVYKKYSPIVEEFHLTAPRNPPEWGRWVEFELEHRGDLVRKFHLRITLPTWLPPDVAAVNPTSYVDDLSGVSYGYCNNIGYQVIDKIQVYQDQLLIQELYGEYLDWKVRQAVPTAQVLVMAASVGSRGETPMDVSRSATPGTLRVPIPLLGWENVGDPGFPTISVRNQRFRIRILLRNLEEVVVASDGRLKPTPWTMALRVQKTKGGIQESFTPLSYPSVAKGITMYLETTQVYVTKDVQEWLRVSRWQIPYRTTQFLEFHVADNQMNAATTAVANFTLPFSLDFTGAGARLFVALQRGAARKAGQRTALLKDAVRLLRMNVNNLDRMQSFPPEVYREVVAYWKHIRAPQDVGNPEEPQEVFTFVFGGRESPQPAGTLNFTRANIPLLWILFGPVSIDPRTLSRDLFVVTYLETFELLECEDGKGKRVLLE